MKRPLQFLLLFLAGVTSQAQVEQLATVRLDGSIKNTIIRNYKDDFSVSYIETSLGCYFALSDNYSFVNLVELDCDYKVYDFEIFEDTVVFCGEQLLVPGHRGFVGWFCCPDLFGGTDAFHIKDFFQARSYDEVLKSVTVFKDLVTYIAEDPQYRNIAVVGETEAGIACVAELTGTFVSNNWTYKTGCPPSIYEHMDHIVVTDHYIVVGGVPSQWYTGIELRVFYKYSMFQSITHIEDYVHYYPFFATVPPAWGYPMVDFQMTATKGDSVGTLSFMSFGGNQPGLDGIITHIFDVNATAYGPLGTPCAYNSYVSVANSYSLCSSNRVTYNAQQSGLVGLSQTNIPSGANTTAFGEFPIPPFSVPPTGTMMYSHVDQYHFYCHDNFPLVQGIVALGKYLIEPDVLAFYTKPLQFSELHCGKSGFALTDEGGFLKKDDSSPLTTYDDIFVFDVVQPLGITEKMLDVECELGKED